TYYVDGREIAFANYAEIVKQLPALKKKYIYARDFARADLPELFGQSAWAEATVFEIQSMQSMLLQQGSDGSFRSTALPESLQWSSIHAIQQVAGDATTTRFLVGGNFLNANIELGWYDAGRLGVLAIDTSGEMRVTYPANAPSGQVRNMEAIGLVNAESAYLVAFNNDSLRLFRQIVD
ncbi:MAG: hypothetical protein WA952_06690, partial [Lewinella sp.]